MLGVGLNISSAAVSGAATAGSPAPFSNTKSLLFDGSNDYFDTNYTANTVWRDSFSVSWWMKPTDGRPPSTDTIFGITNSTTDRLIFTISNLGTLSLLFKANNEWALVATAAARFTDGVQSDYKHYVLVVTKVTSGDTTYALYEDGSVCATEQLLPGTFEVSDTGHSLFDTDGTALNIGADNNSSAGALAFHGGNIDEFALFDRALSSDAANEIYNGGDPTNLAVNGTYFSASNVALYYRFEDDATDTAETSDGTNNGATFSSTVPSS